MYESEKTPRDLELDRIAANHLKHRVRADGATVETPEEKPVPKDEKGLDLDDHGTQERILHPEGVDVELSYQTIRLFPAAAMVQKLVYGFCNEILAESTNEPSRTEAVFIARVASKVMAGPAPMARLFRLTAYLTGKPGTVDDQTALEISTELMQKTNGDDVIALFTHLLEVSGIRKKPTAPKK